MSSPSTSAPAAPAFTLPAPFVQRLYGEVKAIRGVNGRTINGLAFDVAKSGLQKSIRQGNVEQAVYFGLDVFTCALLSSRNPVSDGYYKANASFDRNGRTTMKALVTNLLNRLRICACEDVGMACVGVYAVMEAHLRRVEAWRAADCPLPGFHAACSSVAQICALLASAPKSRAFSEFRAVLQLPPYVGTGSADSAWRPHMRANAETVVALCGIDFGDVSARIPLFQTLVAFRDALTAARYNPARADESEMLSVMKRFVEARCGANASVRAVLMQWYAVRKDPAILYAAIGACFKPIGLGAPLVPPAPEAVRACMASFFSLCPEGPSVAIVTEDMVDVHTAKGRAKGRSPVDFAIRGAAVVGGDPALHDDRCQLAYILAKVANQTGRAVTREELVDVCASHPALLARLDSVPGLREAVLGGGGAVVGEKRGAVPVSGEEEVGKEVEDSEKEEEAPCPPKRVRKDAPLCGGGEAPSPLLKGQ